MPIHYEVLIEGKNEGEHRVMVLFHEDLELECLPVETLN